MKVSEITPEYVAEYLRADYEAEKQLFSDILAASKAYIKSYTGAEDLDIYEDLSIAALIVCGDMYDNRQLTLQYEKVNPAVEQILALHSYNLL